MKTTASYNVNLFMPDPAQSPPIVSVTSSVTHFDADYYATGCGPIPYGRHHDWLTLMAGFAERIKQRINPATVLDAGCAMGLLVEKLRENGVAAWGVDLSEYAIQQVHPSVREFCQVGSIAEPFGQRYDLIVTIEVLEHIPKAESERAVANLCAHTDDILFSSSPNDHKEPTHFNVQPPEYWAEQFALHGFYRDLTFDASFITPWSVRFRRGREPFSRVVYSYEQAYARLLDQNQQMRAALAEIHAAKAKAMQLEADLAIAQAQLQRYEGGRWAGLIRKLL